MRRLDPYLVCLYLLVAALPYAAMKFKVKDKPVSGSLEPTPRPALTFAGFKSEAYQKAYTAWFESRLGLKGYSVHTDNAILLHAFGETKQGSQVMIGEDGVLFKDEDIWFYNKDGAALPTQARVDAMADKILVLQRKLQDTKQAFVPMLIPSKTSVYRDKVPASWTRDIGQPRPTDTAIYQAFKKALDVRKVVYVDARESFTSGKYEREHVWGHEARHWSSYGACLAMSDAVRAYTTLTGKPTSPDPCAMRRTSQPRRHEDYDLWRLLNAWFQPRRTRHIPTIDYASPAPTDAKLSTMIVGTSFCWALIRYAYDSKLFDKIYMDYYNRTVVDWPENIHNDVHPHSKEWNDKFLGRDLYVLDLLEVFLLAPDTYVDEFLAQLDRALAPAQTADSPRSEVTTGATISSIIDLGVSAAQHHFEIWGSFPNPAATYSGSITCDGVRHDATVYYQNPNAQQINVRINDPGSGACDRTLTPARTLGVQCTFHFQQGQTIGTPITGPRRVCAGPQGTNGQDSAGNCLPGLAGC